MSESLLSVAVVDDELSTVEGLSGILGRHPDEFRVAGAFTAPQTALDFLACAAGGVDVMIMDVKMPAMDGITLLRRMSREYPAVKAVMLSGHSDYEYVRQCLTVGAVDYLLKPCRYQSLLALLRSIRLDKSRREDRRLRESIEEQLRAMILSGQKPAPVALSFRRIQAAFFRGGKERRARLEAKLRQQLLEHGDRGNGTLTVEMPDGLFLLSEERGDAQFLRFCNALKEEGGAAAWCGGLEPEGMHLNDDLNRCRELAGFAEFNSIGRMVDTRRAKALLDNVEEFPLMRNFSAAGLSSLFYKKDREALLQKCDQVCREVSALSGYLDPRECRKQTVQFFFGVERTLEEIYGMGGALGAEYGDYLGEIAAVNTLKELLASIRGFLVAAAGCCNSVNAYPHYINTAVAYIKANYMKEIHLSDLSREVFLNEWYFSSQFKKHTGMSFREYLNSIRIQSAKELLCHSDLKVAQIADMVGFADPTYFATTFKGLEGKTPKEYQRQVACTAARRMA